MAIDYEYMVKIREALDIYEHILLLNPHDNEGCRSSAVWCYLELNDPDGVLNICKKYPKDWIPEVSYGRALALLRRGRGNEGEESLKQAIKDLPKVAHELARAKHPKIAPDRKCYVTVGGREQACFYWVNYGGYWKDTEGAIELIRKCLEQKGKRFIENS